MHTRTISRYMHMSARRGHPILLLGSPIASRRSKLDGFESPETQPFENRDHLAGICWTASALLDDSSVHRRSMDYAIIASPQLGRDHRRGSNHGRTRGQVGGHLFLPPQTATNCAPNTGRRCCSCPRSRPNPQSLGLLQQCVGWTVSIHVQATPVCNECGGAEKLHWLGFPHRVTYKLCVLIYKGLHGLAPDYLSRRCVRVRDVPGRAHLRSASAGQLMVPITNKKTIGDKGFSHCGPVAWNNLPLHLRSDDYTPSLDCFKKHLKTALFKLTTQK